MKKDDVRIDELTAALHSAERKLAEREALITQAFGQTEAARSQYEQANERAETLRRRLEAKEEQLSVLQQGLQQRDERIAALEQLCLENDNALHAINQDIKHQNHAKPSEQLTALGLVLESLDDPGVRHRIFRVTTTLGRATSNDIAINSTSVSRYHARIVVGSDGTNLIDLQSTNGCTVNGQPASRQIIGDHDVIGIGDVKFRLAVGVPLAELEDRSMDETHALLEDSVIFTPAPKPPNSARARGDKGKAK